MRPRSPLLPRAFQLKREQLAPVHDVVQYYFRLRTLCYCWAFCGNWLLVDHDGSHRKMIALSEALDYAGSAVREAMTFGRGNLQWLERCDTVSRGRMASLVRRGWTAGSALKEARRESYLDWRTPSGADSAPMTPKRKPLPEIPETPRPSLASTRQCQDCLHGEWRETTLQTLE